MSDLRDLIAAAIQARWTDLTLTDSWSWDETCSILADAVIRELGIKEVTDVNRTVPQSRYVTEWRSK